MDTSGAIDRLETAVEAQVQLSGADPEIEQAAEALMAALRPAIEQMALELAQQAAAEVTAQLSAGRADVVMREGEPWLEVRAEEGEVTVNPGDFVARLTLRLPEDLKSELEDAATELGDSINSYVVKRLSTAARTSKSSRGRRFQGTVET